MSKERAYDQHIAPLMSQIIELCQRHKINAFATFVLTGENDGSPFLCTTAMSANDEEDVRGGVLVQRLRIAVGNPRNPSKQ